MTCSAPLGLRAVAALVFALSGLLQACGADAVQSGPYPGNVVETTDASSIGVENPIDAGVQDGSAPGLDAAGWDAEPSCVPKGCDEQGFECGMAEDGCGGVVDCSGIKTCKGFDICGAVEPNKCGCERRTCESVAVQSGRQACGTLEVGCGEDAVECGDSCPAGQSCGAVEPNVCGCVPNLSACSDKQCGSIPDGCGGEVSCGSCPAGGVCNAQQRCICNGVPCETETEDPCPACDAATRAMVGRYVMRNVSFAVSSLSPNEPGRNDNISIMEIKLDAERQLVLNEEACQVKAYGPPAENESEQGEIPLARASKLETPPRIITVEGGQWRVPSVRNALGWRRGVSYCKPGSAAPDKSDPGYHVTAKSAGAAKPWIRTASQECECVFGPALPSSANDCRVIDDDGDMRPGLTFSSSVGDAYMVSVTDVDMWGSIDLVNRRHQGTSLDGPDSAQKAFQCTSFLALVGCSDIGKDTRFCPESYNTVDFLPLDVLERSLGRKATCADIIENSSNRAAVGLGGAGGIEQTRGRTYPSAAVCR